MEPVDGGPVYSASRDKALYDNSLRERCRDSCWCGRCIKDWSQYIVLGAGCTGSGGVITGYLMKDSRVVLISVGVLALNTLFACSRISCLKPKKALEEQLEDANDKVSRLEVTIEEFKEKVVDLEKAFAKANSTIEGLEKSLDEKVADLQEVADNCEVAVGKLWVVEKQFKNYKLAIRELAKNVNLYARTDRAFKGHVRDASNEVKELKANKKELTKKIDKFADVAEYQKHNNEVLDPLLNDLGSSIGTMIGFMDELKRQVKELRSLTDKVDVADDKIRGGLELLAERVAELKGNKDRLEGLRKGIERKGKRKGLERKGKGLEEDDDSFTISVNDDDDDEGDSSPIPSSGDEFV
ncbi:MAG: Chromosome partition protein Smc [Chlamydiae bacterium]|nr:Chromosome partition protein Smc [Chlamydiota bacterium]